MSSGGKRSELCQLEWPRWPGRGLLHSTGASEGGKSVPELAPQNQ